jgi:hypothetical protein
MGTKLLPRDIIVPLSNLYPHRLWGKPEEVKSNYMLRVMI